MRYRVIKERCKITSVKTEGARLLEKLLKKKKKRSIVLKTLSHLGKSDTLRIG